MVSKKTIKKMVDIIVEKYQPEKVILFGSYATGIPNADSDVDILIIKDTDLPRYKRGKYIRKYLTDFRFPKDIIIYTPSEIERWKDCQLAFITSAVNNGEILYDKQGSRKTLVSQS